MLISEGREEGGLYTGKEENPCRKKQKKNAQRMWLPPDTCGY